MPRRILLAAALFAVLFFVYRGFAGTPEADAVYIALDYIPGATPTAKGLVGVLRCLCGQTP